MWEEKGAIASATLFACRPGATEEDDGVLLSWIYAGDGRQYMLLLDGRTFREVARIGVPKHFNFPNHTWFFRESS